VEGKMALSKKGYFEKLEQEFMQDYGDEFEIDFETSEMFEELFGMTDMLGLEMFETLGDLFYFDFKGKLICIRMEISNT
jgi:hypothetical protein